MKNIEKLARIVLVLFLISKFINPIHSFIATRIHTPIEFSQISILYLVSSYLVTMLALLVNIVIGIWLFKLAKKEPDATPWVWFLLCLFAGIYVPILFFLIKVYNSVKPAEQSIT